LRETLRETSRETLRETSREREETKSTKRHKSIEPASQLRERGMPSERDAFLLPRARRGEVARALEGEKNQKNNNKTFKIAPFSKKLTITNNNTDTYPPPSARERERERECGEWRERKRMEGELKREREREKEERVFSSAAFLTPRSVFFFFLCNNKQQFPNDHTDTQKRK
jgi:hypothetical protein